MNVQPMYFGESAPKRLRGAISLSSAVFTAFGVVLGQVVGLRYAEANLSKPSEVVKTRTMFTLLCGLLTERSWAGSSVGSIFLPVTPFLASSSSPPCRGSRRAPDTCSSTGGTKRPVLMVLSNVTNCIKTAQLDGRHGYKSPLCRLYVSSETPARLRRPERRARRDSAGAG